MENIDCIYYINLEHRKDRNELFLETMNDLKVPTQKIERINAIKHMYGAMGCTRSHILTLETFLKSDHKVCLVLEDDFIYKDKETFWSDIQKIFDTKIPFDIVQLSYDNKYCPDKYYVVSDTDFSFLKRVQKTISSSSYIITREFAPILIKNFLESSELLEKYNGEHEYVLDLYWHRIQANHLWYCISPSIGYQRGSYSDLLGHYTDNGV